MWNLLLLEDEPFVRRSIRQAINWESLGFRVVAEAEDGNEAWEFMQAHHVDVVLSDIMMPIMNGIELIRTAKQAGHEAEFIMLTCVNEFEYARLALQYGAVGYLLKASMDMEELKGLLLKIKHSLIKKRDQRTKAPMFNLYHNIWRSLHGLEEMEQKEDEEELLRLPTYVRLFVGSANNASLVNDRIMNLFDMNCRDKLLVHPFINWGITTVLVWSDERYIPITPVLTEVCSTTWLTSDELKAGWESLLQGIGRIWYDLDPSIPTMRELQLENLAWKKESLILSQFEAAQWVECEKSLQSLWDYFKERQLAVVMVKEAADRLDRAFARLSNQFPAGKAVWAAVESHRQALEQIVDRVHHYSNHRMKETLTDHPEINKIIAYVNRHYDKELTLKGMAKYVNMGEQYLSGLFKKKTGEQFIQYVQRIRIERACYCLAETELRVAEICEQVGFVHMNYFLKQFKKWTGLTPSEFRESKKAERKKPLDTEDA
ncbi:response regulator [Paenibacillus sp. LMG 31461]|uniref:Response regulator n=1 Tax=Paenibacillus plantarum TaxID=2654975 RepID=A0ABX1X3I3_9BACL|nr:response regulator [Paenibacillus plantarum]NOU62701.1 response regulator [Paenibacillus plantarum]